MPRTRITRGYGATRQYYNGKKTEYWRRHGFRGSVNSAMAKEQEPYGSVDPLVAQCRAKKEEAPDIFWVVRLEAGTTSFTPIRKCMGYTAAIECAKSYLENSYSITKKVYILKATVECSLAHTLEIQPMSEVSEVEPAEDFLPTLLHEEEWDEEEWDELQ